MALAPWAGLWQYVPMTSVVEENKADRPRSRLDYHLNCQQMSHALKFIVTNCSGCRKSSDYHWQHVKRRRRGIVRELRASRHWSLSVSPFVLGGVLYRSLIILNSRLKTYKR